MHTDLLFTDLRSWYYGQHFSSEAFLGGIILAIVVVVVVLMLFKPPKV
jgi:hypothetical protein